MDPEDLDAESEMMIEAPPGLLPHLNDWGIEEIEVGICEDTFENRRALRENKASWVSVFDQFGRPTGHLQVITAEMRNDAMRFRKTAILEEPDDVNSDYITGLNLLLTPDVDRIAPTWVIRRTRQWLSDEEERDALGNGGAIHPSRLVRAPSRCVARKADGSRCWFWNDGSINRDSVCARHSKKKTQDKVKPDLIALARTRLTSAAHGAVDELESLMNTAVSEPVRLGAAKEILDRVGIRGGIEIEQKTEVTVLDATKILQNRLDKLAEQGKKRAELEELVQAREFARSVEGAKSEPEPEPEPEPQTVVIAEVVDDE